MAWNIDVGPELVERAREGDRAATEAVAHALVTPVFNLSVRFLFEPVEAEDAAQESIVRVLKGLRSFRGESAFSTWVYRIVVRTLSNVRRGRRESLTLAEGIEALEAGLREASEGPEDSLLVEEVKLSCTTALLVCLPRSQRLAYVLGEIVGMKGPEAAAVLDIAPTAFRQRLAAARKTVRGFFRSQCGLIDPTRPCRCEKQVAYCKRVGFIDETHLRFANRGVVHRQATRGIDDALSEVQLYWSHPTYAPSSELGLRIRTRLAEALDAEA